MATNKKMNYLCMFIYTKGEETNDCEIFAKDIKLN